MSIHTISEFDNNIEINSKYPIVRVESNEVSTCRKPIFDVLIKAIWKVQNTNFLMQPIFISAVMLTSRTTEVEFKVTEVHRFRVLCPNSIGKFALSAVLTIRLLNNILRLNNNQYRLLVKHYEKLTLWGNFIIDVDS